MSLRGLVVLFLAIGLPLFFLRPLWAGSEDIFIDPSDPTLIRETQIPFESKILLRASDLPEKSSVHSPVPLTDQSFLSVVPDPQGKQEPVTLLRLAILVDAESAWTFTAAALVPPGPALEAEKARGRDLALLAEDLWALAANRIGPPAVPDHPHFLFDRSPLEPVPVPGFGGSR